MKVMTILGTRPEIIRLSRIIPLLDDNCEHVLVHTGQNYNDSLNDVFFNELKIRRPDYCFESQSKTAMEQIGKILFECEKIILKEKPDKVLILGDTNSGLSAIVAKRMNIPVYHLEAGNRCFDDRVPEEVNRRIIDHSSDIFMPYTERSRANLLREGIANDKIFVIGNPINEVLKHYENDIENSSILTELDLSEKKYFLVTLHRAENVDIKKRLNNFTKALHRLYEIYNMPVVCSVHPRLRSQLEKQSSKLEKKGILALEPFGLFDFVKLEKNAFCVLTDSGTVQEECCIFGIPSVTLRDVTERPETIESGSNMLSGNSVDSILACTEIVTKNIEKWLPPREYLIPNSSQIVLKVLLGYQRKSTC